MFKAKFQIGDIVEGFHIPGASIHLLIEDITYIGKKPFEYCVRNLEEDMTYEKQIDKMDKSLFYRKVA